MAIRGLFQARVWSRAEACHFCNEAQHYHDHGSQRRLRKHARMVWAALSRVLMAC